MEVSQSKMRKFLSKKIQQLNDIVADLDTLVTQMGPDFYRVAIFGSARIKEDTVYYQRVYDLAFALSKMGVDIVTGGGPGLMEAANRGAKDGSKATRSIGLPIELPFESDANAHLDVKYHHRRFSSRLDEFMRISHAIIITPGGIGTLLELLYTWQLIQVGHIQPRPVILLGKEMWADFLTWMREEPLKRGLMSEKDFEMITIVETVDDVMQQLKGELEKFKKSRSG